MKQFSFILICFFMVANTSAQLNPQSKKVTEKFFPDADSIQDVTPALQKKRGFTDYDELVSFLNTLKAAHPDFVNIRYIGESQKGYQIPLVHVTNPNSTEEKIKVWMQGGLHGNEPASTEGLLYTLWQILNNSKYTYLLDRIELAMVPMANIDGYLKQNRLASNGLDLNRDQTKLMAPESVILKQEFSNFNAEVGVDFHEYNAYRRDFAKMSSFGITALYDVMFLYSGNLNVPENIRTMTESLFVENARRDVKQFNLNYYDYMSTADHRGDIVFNQGSSNARSSATSYALTNTFSSIIEVRGVNLGRTSFKRRIATTFLVATSYLKTTYNNVNLVKEEIKKAQEPSSKVTVTSGKTTSRETIEVIDLDTNDILDLEVTINDAWKAIAKLTRDQPAFYLIDKAQTELITKLNILGISTEILKEDQEYEVETYQISAYKKDDLPYEKMYQQTVEVEIVKKSMTFPAGTFIISTQQKNAPILPEVLEPEAPNSFVSFGVLETELNRELPIYRLPKKN